HEIIPKINGVIINGIIITGFKTIGVPNTIGSLILKTAGIKDVFPNAFRYADVEKKANKIASPIVPPEPLILINQWKRGSTTIFGISSPAAYAAVFSSNNTNHNGLAIVPTIVQP